MTEPQAQLRQLADEAAARFAALEADPAHAGHLGRVELSREVLRWAEETLRAGAHRGIVDGRRGPA